MMAYLAVQYFPAANFYKHGNHFHTSLIFAAEVEPVFTKTINRRSHFPQTLGTVPNAVCRSEYGGSELMW